jgi:hypothetical protein
MISDKTDLRIFPPAFLCGFRARLARRIARHLGNQVEAPIT